MAAAPAAINGRNGNGPSTPMQHCPECRLQPGCGGEDARRFEVEGGAVDGTDGAAGPGTTGKVLLGVRPEDIHLAGTLEPERASAPFAARVEVIELLGARAIVTFAIGDAEIKALLEERQLETLREDAEASLVLDHHRLHLFDAETGERVG